MDDDLAATGAFHRHPLTDAVSPFLHLWTVSPEQMLDHCAERDAYLARYGRIPPSEIRDMDPERVDRLVKKVSELVLAEYKARAGNPLDPTTEDSTE